MLRGEQSKAIANLARRAGGPRRRGAPLLPAAAALLLLAQPLADPAGADARTSPRRPGSATPPGATGATWLVPLLPTPGLSGRGPRSHGYPHPGLALGPPPASTAPPALAEAGGSVLEALVGAGCPPGDLACPLKAEPPGLTPTPAGGRGGSTETPSPAGGPNGSANGGAEAPVPATGPPQTSPPGGTEAPESARSLENTAPSAPASPPPLGSPESDRSEQQLQR